MTTKKILSVLLALVMTLSLGAAAFADDNNYNWVSIPGSPDGLANGDYYLDWTYFLTYSTQGSSISPTDLAKLIDVYNNGTWFIDYDAPALKGTVVYPADMTQSGVEETEEFEDQTSLLHVLLNEVGAQWIPVAKSTAGLSEGDWYIDLSGDQATIAVSQQDIDSLATYLNDWLFFVNANQDSRYMKYKVLVNGELGDEYDVYYLPMFNEMLSWADGTIHIPDLFPIQQYTAPENWAPIPTSPEGLEDGDYYLDFTYDWNAWSPNVRQARLDMWNAGTWYVDHADRMVKGSFTVPANQSNTGVSFVQYYNPFTPDSYSLYVNALMRVGNWVKIPTSPDGLSNGDFYMDVAALAAVLGTTVADLNSAGTEYYGDAISGDIYMTVPGYYRNYFGDDASVRACMIEVKTETPTGPETPEQTETPSQSESPLQHIVKAITSFFLRVVDFFKRMFAK